MGSSGVAEMFSALSCRVSQRCRSRLRRVEECQSAVRGKPTRGRGRLPPDDLLEDGRILDVLVAGQQQHLGDHLRRARIVVGKRQEQPAKVLGVDGDHAQRPARLLVDHTAALVHQGAAGASAPRQHEFGP